MLTKVSAVLLKASCTAFVLVAFMQYAHAARQKGVLEIKNVVVSYLCQESDSQISLREYENEPDSTLCNLYNEKTNGECSKLEQLWKRAESKCNDSETDSVFLKCYSADILSHLLQNNSERQDKEEFEELKRAIQGIVGRNVSSSPGSSVTEPKPAPPIELGGGSVEKTSFNSLGLISVLLSLFSIGALVFLWLRFNRLKGETDRRLSARLKKEDAQRLSDDISLLRQKLGITVSNNDLSEFRNDIERRVSKIEKQTERASTSSLGAETLRFEPTKTSPPPQIRHLNKYAFFPENNLFEDKTLQDDQDHSEAIYHLSFREDSNHGEYEINQSAKAIQIALSDPEQFLSPGAEFEQRPSGSSGIANLSKGELKRVSEGWQIVKKVKIKFE